MFYLRCSSLLLLLGFVVGCGGSGDRVTGTVTFADGTPLTVGKVMFTNNSVTAFGNINAKGEFRMGTNKAGDGVPSGTYQVYITDARVPASFTIQDEDGNTSAPLVLAIDPKFTTPARSGLTCEVKGATTFNISVEKLPANYSPTKMLDPVSRGRGSN